MIEIYGQSQSRLQVCQGQFAIGTQAEQCIFAILGSCVATAIWDPNVGVGGLNHILLPSGSSFEPDLGAVSAKVNEMEVLINAVIRNGGQKSNLLAKVFGGSKMIEGLGDIGKSNVSFVDNFLNDEGIQCVARSVGGELGRRIQFWPFTGRAQQKFIVDVQIPVQSSISRDGGSTTNNDVELWT